MVDSTTWMVWEGVIPPEKCTELIQKFYVEDESIDATVFDDDGNPEKKASVRQTRLCWDKDRNSELSKLLFDFGLAANSFGGWRLSLERLEDVQVAKYENSAFYNYHVDAYFGKVDQFGFQRKLTAILLLSDPKTYDGGDFSFFTGEEVFMPKKQGTVIVFPGTTLHRVSPVTEGVRFSATAWVGGAPFR